MIEGNEPLIDQFYDFMSSTWSGDGINMGMLLKPDGSLTMIALDLEPEQAYEMMLQMVVVEQATEAVFALDRFAKPDQGTKYNDLLAGQYFDRSLGKSPWRPFIIEYQIEPRVFDPVDWDNFFWNDALLRELHSSMRSMVNRMVSTIMNKEGGHA